MNEHDEQANDGSTAETARRIVAAVWDLPDDPDGLAFSIIYGSLLDPGRAAFVMMSLAQFAAASIAELASARDLDPMTVLQVLTDCNQRLDFVGN
jgi:hypothetical protein